jgi:hypothetical protein
VITRSGCQDLASPLTVLLGNLCRTFREIMVLSSAVIRLPDEISCKLLGTADEGTVPFFVTVRLMGPVLDHWPPPL